MGERFFHNHDKISIRYSSFESAVSSSEITPDDRDYIYLYIDTKKAFGNISNTRSVKISSALLSLRKHMITKQYSDLRYIDVITGVRNLLESKLADNTKSDYVIILKGFLIWMVKKKYNLLLSLEELQEIKAPKRNLDTKHPDDILEPDEIVRMIGAALNSRDRALIAMQYEMGTRVAELCRLKWRDILYDPNPEYGARVMIMDRKTRKTRIAVVTLPVSLMYLNVWRNDYPGEPLPDSYVFVSLRKSVGEPLTYPTVQSIIKRVAERAKINKRVYSHLLRGSRITHLLEQGLSENIVKEIHWGNQGTGMIRVYARMHPEQIVKGMLRHQGIEIDEHMKARVVEGRTCSRCGLVNPPTALYCNKCRLPLTSEEEDKVKAAYEAVSGTYEYMVKKMEDLEKEQQALKSEISRLGPQDPSG